VQAGGARRRRPSNPGMALPDPAALGLAPHPEGGFYRELHRSPLTVRRADGGERSALTSIHFLLPPGGISRWHRVRDADEWWQVVEGSLRLWIGPTPAEATVRELRPGAAGHAVVPAGWWQAAEAPAGALCVCLVGPGFAFTDFDLIDGAMAAELDPDRRRLA
jgi:predicted cupin superfamily sugar epimerase